MSGINDLWSELCDEGLALSDHSSEHVSKIMGIMEKHLFYAFDDGRRSAIEECAEIASDAFCNGETDQCADRIRQLLPEEL